MLGISILINLMVVTKQIQKGYQILVTKLLTISFSHTCFNSMVRKIGISIVENEQYFGVCKDEAVLTVKKQLQI